MATLATSQILNPSAWGTAPDMPGVKSAGNAGSNGSFRGTFLQTCGDNGSSTNTVFQFNLAAWSTVTATSFPARVNIAGGEFNTLFYLAGGLSGGAAEKYNNSSWATFTDPYGNVSSGGAARVDQFQLFYWLRGNLASSPSDTTFQMNAAESTSSLPTTSGQAVDSMGSIGMQGKLYKMGGEDSNPTAQSVVKSWNNSSWATETSLPAVKLTGGVAPTSNSTFGFIGGQTIPGGAAVTSVLIFNLSTWITATQTLGTATRSPGGCGGL